MTILFFSRLFYPHIGGVEKHVFEISKRMVSDGHTVNIVTENDAWPTLETIEGISIYRMHVGKDDRLKKFRIWLWLEKHKHLIANADIIHCHDVFFWYFPFRFYFIHKPVYTTFHGYETVFPPSKKALFIRKVSEIISFGNICVGDYIQKWYGTNPVYVTYGGVTSLKQTNTIKIGKKLNIIYIGRLEMDTGIPTYLKTLDILKKKNIPFSFQAYGDGSYRKEVEAYGVVYGFTENAYAKLHEASIVFTASYLSILEAFSQQKLVFSVFNNALKKDYLLMTPFSQWIVSSNSENLLAEKIIYYTHNHKGARKIIMKEKTWVDTQTWDSVVNLYYKLWKI